jgi:hypothetical protein
MPRNPANIDPLGDPQQTPRPTGGAFSLNRSVLSKMLFLQKTVLGGDIRAC